MARERWLLFLVALLVGFSLRCHSEGGSRWRVYGAVDGLDDSPVVAVTVSPRGHVWAKHGSGPVSWLDGFQAHSVPLSGSGNFAVYESRSGQIWSLYLDGVTGFRRDQWMQYPVNEIRSENQSSPLRLVRPIPLLPVERDHLMAVLPDLLLGVDSRQKKSILLRSGPPTHLRRINDT